MAYTLLRCTSSVQVRYNEFMKRYAKYKPSGIEWIGEIPEHWKIVPFKRITKRIEVGIAEAATQAYVNEGVPILRATNIKKGKIVGELRFIEESFAKKNESKSIFHNDIVTVRTGNAGTCFALKFCPLNACRQYFPKPFFYLIGY